MNPADVRQTDRVLIIGIDLGTTYSSVAWNTFEKLNGSITAVPGQLSAKELRNLFFGDGYAVKTQLAWDNLNDCWLWGSEVDQEIEEERLCESSRIDMIKLGLDTSPYTSSVRDRLAMKIDCLPPRCGDRSVQALITVYLEKLYNCAKTMILGLLKGKGCDDVFERNDVKCAICIPAMWFHDMSVAEKMRSAALDAGIANVELVSEPEAAATYMIHEELKLFSDNQGGVHEYETSPGSFLVADVGGGTGDFTTYIYGIEGQNLSMREGNRGDGGACGSALLNERFREFIQQRYNTYMPQILEDLRKKNKQESVEEVLHLFVASFEKAKKKFNDFSQDSRTEGRVTISVPGLQARPGTDIYDGRVLISNRHIANIFLTILEPIIEKIYQQIEVFNSMHDGKITTIMFVGGLSSSDHVYEWLAREFEVNVSNRIGYSVSILRHHQTYATLVSSGSVLSVLHKGAISERYLRCSVGFVREEEYDEELHPEPYQRAVHGDYKWYYDFWDSRRRVVKDRITFLFRLGEAIRPGQENILSGYRCLDMKGDDIITERVFTSHQVSEDHLAVKDPLNGIKPLGFIQTTVTEEHKTSLRKKPSDNGTGWCRVLEYRVVAKLDYPRLIYEIVFPRRQKFPNTGNLSDMGRDPIRKVAELHLAAEFGVNRRDWVELPTRNVSPSQRQWDEQEVLGERTDGTSIKSPVHAHKKRRRHVSGLAEQL